MYFGGWLKLRYSIVSGISYNLFFKQKSAWVGFNFLSWVKLIRDVFESLRFIFILESTNVDCDAFEKKLFYKELFK